jgi:ATP-dependent DNA ligase
VVDGEIVVGSPTGLDFDALLQRIHPARSRIESLAKTTPASFMAFGLLAAGDTSLLRTRFAERRRRLEEHLTAAEPGASRTMYAAQARAATDVSGSTWIRRFRSTWIVDASRFLQVNPLVTKHAGCSSS